MLESISNFIFERELVVIHYVFITVIGGLIVLLIAWLLSAIWKAIKPVREFIAKVKRYQFKDMPINEYINIKERLKNGGQIRWYEKKAYKAMKQKEDRCFSKTIKNRRLEMPQLPHIKEFPNRQDRGDSGHDKTDA